MNKKAFSINKKTIITILLLGLMILAFCFTEGFIKSKEQTATKEERYCQYLEDKLTRTLEGAIGKGNVNAMITLKIPYSDTENNSVTPTFSIDEKKIDHRESEHYKISGVMIVCRNLTSPEDFATIKKAAATALGIQEKQIFIIGGDTSNEKNP